MATVYFLGAGASKAFIPSMPTARELTLRSLLDRRQFPYGSIALVDPSGDGLSPDAVELLRRAVREGVLSETDLEARIEDVLGRAPHGEPLFVFENLVIAVMQRLSIHDNPRFDSIDQLLFSAKDRGDSIITTNYDTLLELHIGELTVYELAAYDWLDFGVPCVKRDFRRPVLESSASEPGCLPLLKLHGSVSWSVCLACGSYHFDPIHQSGAVNAMVGWEKCPACGRDRLEGGARGLIVPPMAEKDYDDEAVRSIWGRARRELRGANRIVFAGFSLDDTDSGIRALLRDTDGPHLTEVEIVDPFMDETLVARYRALYGDRLRIRRQSWKDYLEDHDSSNAEIQ